MHTTHIRFLRYRCRAKNFNTHLLYNYETVGFRISLQLLDAAQDWLILNSCACDSGYRGYSCSSTNSSPQKLLLLYIQHFIEIKYIISDAIQLLLATSINTETSIVELDLQDFKEQKIKIFSKNEK